MKKLLLIVFTLSLIFTACTSNQEKIKKKEIKTKQTQSEPEELIQKENKNKQEALNNSLIIKLFERFPSALRTDSIQDTFTYYFQDLLKKSSNLIFIEEAWIKDIEEIDGSYVLSIYNYDPKIVGKFLLNSQLSTRLLKELKPDDMDEVCCLVAKVNGIVPIRTDVALKIEKFTLTPNSTVVSEKDIRDYIHIGFEPDFFPFYFINGELIDFYLLK